MTTDRDLERAIDRLTETMAEYAVAKVQAALALERDRHDAEVAELREDVAALGMRVTKLADLSNRLATIVAEGERLHSVRVEP